MIIVKINATLILQATQTKRREWSTTIQGWRVGWRIPSLSPTTPLQNRWRLWRQWQPRITSTLVQGKGSHHHYRRKVHFCSAVSAQRWLQQPPVHSSQGTCWWPDTQADHEINFEGDVDDSALTFLHLSDFEDAIEIVNYTRAFSSPWVNL